MKKKFGQNFLINDDIKKKIIDSANIDSKSIIYEIGPGDGSLTKEIIKKNPHYLVAVEIDTSLKNKLNQFFSHKNYKIFYEDALVFDETVYFEKETTIIGNLPYNISIKLLIKWIHQYYKKKWFNEMILMFQKEVAERILANHNNKKYGRISLICSALFNVTKVVDVKKNNFFPEPKVDSAVLKFVPHKIAILNLNEFSKLEILSRNLFANRRKKLKNKILELFNNKDIELYGLKNFFDLRAENLSKEQFFFLSKIL